MAYLPETPRFDDVYQLEAIDPLLGHYEGVPGELNWAPQALVNRTAYLKQRADLTDALGIQLTVADAAALRLVDLTAGLHVALTFGALSAGDGGGGLWRWDAASTAVDNTGTAVLPTGHSGSGRWLRQYSGPVNVSWFGASGDGATDDTAAISAALAVGDIVFPRGGLTYSVGTLAIPSDRILYGQGSTLAYFAATVGSRVVMRDLIWDGGWDCARIVLSHQSDITLSGCTFRNICLGDGAGNPVLGYTAAIEMNSTVSLTIDGCVFDGIRSSGDDGIVGSDIGPAVFLVGQGATYWAIRHSIFRHAASWDEASGNYNAAFMELPGFMTPYDPTVPGNKAIAFPFLEEIPGQQGNGIGPMSAAYGTITNNRFYLDNTNSALKLYCSSVRISDNYFELGTNVGGNNGNGYYSLAFIRGANASDVDIINNTFALAGSGKILSIVDYVGVHQMTIAENVVRQSPETALSAETGRSKCVFTIGPSVNTTIGNNHVTIRNIYGFINCGEAVNLHINHNLINIINDHEAFDARVYIGTSYADGVSVDNKNILSDHNHITIDDSANNKLTSVCYYYNGNPGMIVHHHDRVILKTSNTGRQFYYYRKYATDVYFDNMVINGVAQLNCIPTSTFDLTSESIVSIKNMSFLKPVVIGDVNGGCLYNVEMINCHCSEGATFRSAGSLNIAGSTIFKAVDIKNSTTINIRDSILNSPSGYNGYLALYTGPTGSEVSRIPMVIDRCRLVMASGSTAPAMMRVVAGKINISLMGCQVDSAIVNFISSTADPTTGTDPTQHITWDNVPVANKLSSGSTANRPTVLKAAGYRYFDVTLNKPIWWTGAAWVDATGTTV